MSLLVAHPTGKTASASFIGKGVLAVVAAIVIKSAVASFAGVGVLSATGPVRIKTASASLVGVGTLSVSGTRAIKSGAAAFVGRGTLSATPVKVGASPTVAAGRHPSRRLHAYRGGLAYPRLSLGRLVVSDPHRTELRGALRLPHLLEASLRARPPVLVGRIVSRVALVGALEQPAVRVTATLRSVAPTPVDDLIRLGLIEVFLD